MMTLPQIREGISNVLLGERLKVCDQNEYHCFRSTCWLNRTKQAIENCYNR
jgi:hypothetical protein